MKEHQQGREDAFAAEALRFNWN